MKKKIKLFDILILILILTFVIIFSIVKFNEVDLWRYWKNLFCGVAPVCAFYFARQNKIWSNIFAIIIMLSLFVVVLL